MDEIDNPGLLEALWQRLRGRLWHATSRDGVIGIISTGEIQVGTGDRSRGSLGRQLTAISLFDFGPTACLKPEWNQFRNWSGWLGGQEAWFGDSRIAIWLEIDPNQIAKQFIDAGAAHRLWCENRGRQFIPGVEAFHRGSIPLRTIIGGLMIARTDQAIFEEFSNLDGTLSDTMAAFEQRLPPSKGSRIVEILRAGRDRVARDGNEE